MKIDDCGPVVAGGGFGASFCVGELDSDCKRRDKPDNAAVNCPEPQLRRYEEATLNEVETNENQLLING